MFEKSKLIVNAILCWAWLATHDLNGPAKLCLCATLNLGDISLSHFDLMSDVIGLHDWEKLYCSAHLYEAWLICLFCIAWCSNNEVPLHWFDTVTTLSIWLICNPWNLVNNCTHNRHKLHSLTLAQWLCLLLEQLFRNCSWLPIPISPHYVDLKLRSHFHNSGLS